MVTKGELKSELTKKENTFFLIISFELLKLSAKGSKFHESKQYV